MLGRRFFPFGAQKRTAYFFRRQTCRPRFLESFVHSAELFLILEKKSEPDDDSVVRSNRRKRWMQKTTWQFCWWPFWDGENVTLSRAVGDLQPGDKKVTLNHHLVHIVLQSTCHLNCKKPACIYGELRADVWYIWFSLRLMVQKCSWTVQR